MGDSFNNLDEVEKFLESIPKFSQKGDKAANFNLDRMVAFCAEAGNPQNKFPSVHVAGTNGKGTTCQMMASVYETAGYKTGLYTSPHLINIRERFRVSGKEIEVSSLLTFFRLFGERVQQYNLTYFELTTAIAFWYFAEEEVDIAMIETGLGGRLDATNILTPLLSIITSVGLDHTQILGGTIEQIALEKAGIIKPNVPVITGHLPEPAKSVIVEKAKETGSECYSADTYHPALKNDRFTLQTENGILEINAAGRKQIDSVNAAITFEATRLLQNQFPLNHKDYILGIEHADRHYPNHAHFEKLHCHREWYFDGAHNPEAMGLLAKELLRRAPATEWIIVLSFMKDKLNTSLVEIWKKFPNLRLYEMKEERAASIEEMKPFFPHATQINEDEILQWADTKGLQSELVIFSGSFYFYEKVRHWMGTIATDYE